MKRTAFLLIAALLVLALPAAAQFTTLNPQGQRFAYAYEPFTGRAFVTNTTDTLPNSARNFWYSASPQTLNFGAVSHLTLQIIHADSFYAYIYIDELSGATWTSSVYTDSVETAQSDTAEIVIRSSTVDRLSGRLGNPIRVRVNLQNVTQGTTTATWNPRWLWKP